MSESQRSPSTISERARKVARIIYIGNNMAFSTDLQVSKDKSHEDALTEVITQSLLDVRNEALEEAAKVAVAEGASYQNVEAWHPYAANACHDVAEKIRELLIGDLPATENPLELLQDCAQLMDNLQANWPHDEPGIVLRETRDRVREYLAGEKE